MLETTTKHDRIREVLLDRIQRGEYAPGDRFPTDHELVREFEVSRPTVAKAVAALERDGLVHRRRGAGTTVAKRDAASARFGLLIPGLGTTEIFEPIAAAIAAAARDDQGSLVWGSSKHSSDTHETRGESERELLSACRQLISDQVAGVFFAPIELSERQTDINERIIAELAKAGVPIVLLDRDYSPAPQRSAHDLVGIDNRHAGAILAQHAVSTGRRRLVFLSKPRSAVTVDARASGYCDAAAALGAQAVSLKGDPTDPAQISVLLETHRPDCISCGNDVTAAELMKTLYTLNKAVPSEIAVTGVDDVRYASLLTVPLTTIHQPCDAIGHAAYRAMVRRVENPDAPPADTLIRCGLVVRTSTAPRTTSAPSRNGAITRGGS